jgi:hypothetical protein
MNRVLAALCVVFTSAVALADIPPPAGFKRILRVHRITTDKEFNDYTFFKVHFDEVKAVKLDPKNAVVFDGAGLAGADLVAVPRDAAKKYASEKEFHKAILEDKVPGMHKSNEDFSTRGTAKITFKGDKLTLEYKLEKIDPKTGIVLTKKPNPNDKDLPTDDELERAFSSDISGILADALPDPPIAARDESSPTPTAPTAYTPRNGVWLAAIAGTLAIVCGGVWLVSRNRRKL